MGTMMDRIDRRAGCPVPDALLAALRGEGPEPERLAVLDHALACADCKPELALLHAVGTDAATSLARHRQAAWRRWVPLAAAAVVVVAAGIGGARWWLDRGADTTTRSGDDGQLDLISPRANEAVSSGPIAFLWHRTPGTLRYTIEVLAADGTTVFTASTTDTVLTAQIGPLSGGGYRWWVRAHLDDGSERRSAPRLLELH